jgi:transposase
MEQLCDGLGAATDLHPLYRRLRAMTLAELEVFEAHMKQLDEEHAELLRVHQDALQRLAAVPGLGVDSAQQMIAEVGPTAITFPTAKHLASWVGTCPGHDESAGLNRSHRAPSGPVVSPARAQRRAAKMLRELRSIGYRVELTPSPSAHVL